MKIPWTYIAVLIVIIIAVIAVWAVITHNSSCEGVPFSPTINGTPTICDLPANGLSINSTTALVAEKANLNHIYLHIIREKEFQRRVAGFVWRAGGWGPYTKILGTDPAGNFGVYFPYNTTARNQIMPVGLAFWFVVQAQNGTYSQFFVAYDLVEGNYTFSQLTPFHMPYSPNKYMVGTQPHTTLTLRPMSVVSVQSGCAYVKGVGCNPGGPAFTVAVNASSTTVPVTHLSAQLMLTEMQTNFFISFAFPDINQSNPLMPNQTASETSGAVVGPVDVLSINGTPAVFIEGTLQNGQSFSYWTNDTTS